MIVDTINAALSPSALHAEHSKTFAIAVPSRRRATARVPSVRLLSGGQRKSKSDSITSIRRLDDTIVPKPGCGVVGGGLLLDLLFQRTVLCGISVVTARISL